MSGPKRHRDAERMARDERPAEVSGLAGALLILLREGAALVDAAPSVNVSGRAGCARVDDDISGDARLIACEVAHLDLEAQGALSRVSSGA